MSPELAAAYDLFFPHLPENTKLVIEDNACIYGQNYIFRLIYTSNNSGRTMAMVAKGDSLPTIENDLLMFYVRQLVLSPKEANVEFARIYWREKNARQQLFLSGELGNIRVSEEIASKDKPLMYGEMTG